MGENGSVIDQKLSWNRSGTIIVYDPTIPMGAVKSTPFALEGLGVKGPGSKIGRIKFDIIFFLKLFVYGQSINLWLSPPLLG